jgi:anti-anti-sigma factor
MRVQESGGATVVTLGPHSLSTGAGATEEALRALAGRWAGRTLELDLSQVGFAGGHGLGVLVRLHGRVQRAGGRLVLRNPSVTASAALRRTRPDRLLAVVKQPEPDSSSEGEGPAPRRERR